MATLEQLLNTIQTQVSRVTTGLSMFDANVNVYVGKYWPPVRTLQQNVKMKPPSACVAIYDRHSSHDSTRWIPSVSATTVVTTSLVATPSQVYVPGFATTSITYSGSITLGDAVSLVTFSRTVAVTDPGDGSVNWTPASAVVYSLLPRDQLVTIPAALAALSNADPIMSQQIFCTAADNVLTITSLIPSEITLRSLTGNGGTLTTEIARRKREMEIIVWAPSPEIRSLVSDPIEDLIAQIETFRGHSGEFTQGLTLPDQSGARVLYVNDQLHEEAVMSDTFRRDLIFAVDYGITTTDQLYSVLAPIVTYNITA